MVGAAGVVAVVVGVGLGVGAAVGAVTGAGEPTGAGVPLAGGVLGAVGAAGAVVGLLLGVPVGAASPATAAQLPQTLGPWLASNCSATAICCAWVACEACAAYWSPPFATHWRWVRCSPP